MQNAHKLLDVGGIYLHQSTLKSRGHSTDEFRPAISVCWVLPQNDVCSLRKTAEIPTLFFKNTVGVLSVNQN